MYSRETRVLLRHYLEQGVGKTELARRFGVSRRTVYHWIETEQLDRDLDDAAVAYTPRPPVTRKLDPYRGIIQERIYEEIRAAGYAGGYTQIKEYVREIRPRSVEEAVQHFETPAGFQGQVDYATFNLPWGRRYALVVVLGYSRLLWLRFYPRQTCRRPAQSTVSTAAMLVALPTLLLTLTVNTAPLSTVAVAGVVYVVAVAPLMFTPFLCHW